MRIGARGGDAATGGPCDKTFLQEIGLVHFADGVGFLAHRRGEALDAYRAAVELVDDRGKDRAVHAIEPAGIDFEQFERTECDLATYDRRGVDLRKIADAAQQPISDTQRATRAPGNLMRTLVIEMYAQQTRRSADDFRQLGGIIEIQMIVLPKAIAERRTQETRSGGRADQRKRLHREAHRAGAGPLADDDVELEILHRGIKDFLDLASQAMNLVNEENIAFIEVVDDGGEVAGALDRGSRGGPQVDTEFARDDVCERSLAESGGSGKEHVVEHFTALTRRGDRHPEDFLEPILADEIAERSRGQ